MSKEQKRLAAIILCIMGIVGSLVAMKDRSMQTEYKTSMQTESTSVSGEKSAECLTGTGNYDKL